MNFDFYLNHVLVAWSVVFSLVVVAIILSGKLDTWPPLARVGLSLTLVGVLADIALSQVSPDPIRYLLVKDIGLSLIVASFFYSYFKKTNGQP